MTELQAYKAMYEFIKIHDKLSPSEDLKFILSGMQLCMCEDGIKRPMDQAFWSDWQDAIKNAESDPDCADVKFVE